MRDSHHRAPVLKTLPIVPIPTRKVDAATDTNAVGAKALGMDIALFGHGCYRRLKVVRILSQPLAGRIPKRLRQRKLERD